MDFIDISAQLTIAFAAIPHSMDIIGFLCLWHACNAADVTVSIAEKKIAGDNIDKSGAALLTDASFENKSDNIGFDMIAIPMAHGMEIITVIFIDALSALRSFALFPETLAADKAGASDVEIG